MRHTHPGPSGISLLLLALTLFASPRASAQDCSNPDEPFQVLDFFLEMDPADWDVIRRDTTFEIERPGLFRCEAELPLEVRIRRKRSDSLPSDVDPRKVSLKVDFDDGPEEASWHDHRKLSLESGVIRQQFPGALLREGISWIIMQRAGAISGAASWVRVHLNDEPLGIYTRVEEIDKSFLRRHLDEDEGFLYKFDRVDPDIGVHRRLTREGEPDPYYAALCWEPFDRFCPVPPDARAVLAEHLDIRQLITMAAVNTLLGNTDGLLESLQNYYFYNSAEPRVYFPWDLDLTMLNDVNRPVHASAVDREFFAAAPDLQPYFDRVLGRLLDETMSDENIDHLLDEIAASVGPAISADPLNHLRDGFDAELERIRTWLKARTAFLRIVVPTYPPAAVVINEILAVNMDTNRDEAGDPDDWVEILNRGTAPVLLSGLFLSDDPANPLLSPLPGVVLPPGGALLVWCDDEPEEGLNHAGFKLDKEGECVGIYEAAGGGVVRVHDFVRFDKQETDRSTGRPRDGAPLIRKLDCPTPGFANETSCKDPVFLRGDVNDDGASNVSDAISGLEWLFRGGPGPGCSAAANVDGSGGIDITDAIYLLTHQFLGGPPPAAPYPECGSGTLPDDGETCARMPESCRR